MTRKRRLAASPLGLRLTAVLVAVAVMAVLLLAGLTLWRTHHTVSRLAEDRRQSVAQSIASTIALDYQQLSTWSGVDAHPAMMVALQAGAHFRVVDANGTPVALQGDTGGMTNAMVMPPATPARRIPVIVGSATVGFVDVAFSGNELALAEVHVRDAVQGTVVLGVLAAGLAAMAVGVPVVRRITRPLANLTTAAHTLASGDRDARVGHHDAPGELGELAAAFDSMADSLATHDRLRRNLTADIAHELRTPLTVLQGTCEEMIDGFAEPSPERLALMHDEVLRLSRLVDDLATLASADSAVDTLRMNLSRVDLGAIVGEAVAVVRPHAELNHQEITAALSPAWVDGDPNRLGQIATNLLTNAVKFTPAGGTIAVDVTNRPDGVVKLRVSDTGPGIPVEDLPHVFERFWRSESVRSIGGSGIGLAVVQQLVDAHHATVTAANNANGGTTFTVLMPAAREAPAADVTASYGAISRHKEQA